MAPKKKAVAKTGRNISAGIGKEIASKGKAPPVKKGNLKKKNARGGGGKARGKGKGRRGKRRRRKKKKKRRCPIKRKKKRQLLLLRIKRYCSIFV